MKKECVNHKFVECLPKNENKVLNIDNLSEKQITPQTNNGTETNSIIPTLGEYARITTDKIMFPNPNKNINHSLFGKN